MAGQDKSPDFSMLSEFSVGTAYNADNEQTKFGSASSMTYDADGELKSDGTNTYLGCARPFERHQRRGDRELRL
jgi:hypothetical protein